MPGTGTPGPTAQPSDNSSGELPVWPFAVGAVVLVGGALLWQLRNRP
jgi:hypothetical protein